MLPNMLKLRYFKDTSHILQIPTTLCEVHSALERYAYFKLNGKSGHAGSHQDLPSLYEQLPVLKLLSN